MMTELSVNLLQHLNQEANTNPASFEKIDWRLSPNDRQLWIPENFSHLYHLPIYQKMTLQERHLYNHFFALLVVEQIATFERDVLQIVEKKIFQGLRNSAACSAEFKQ